MEKLTHLAGNHHVSANTWAPHSLRWASCVNQLATLLCNTAMHFN